MSKNLIFFFKFKIFIFYLKGARIGGSFIRGCADDRCDIQIGIGSYVESKCCYKDLCNDERFFMPDSTQIIKSFNFKSILFVAFITYFLSNFMSIG